MLSYLLTVTWKHGEPSKHWFYRRSDAKRRLEYFKMRHGDQCEVMVEHYRPNMPVRVVYKTYYL